MTPAPAPPSAPVSASTVSLRGWQYVLFVLSPARLAEMTAYVGLARRVLAELGERAAIRDPLDGS